MTFIISGVRETGTITYHCTTTRNALDKVHDFQRAEYRDISIVAGKDHRIPESRLVSMMDLELAEPALG